MSSIETFWVWCLWFGLRYLDFGYIGTRPKVKVGSIFREQDLMRWLGVYS